MPVQTDAALKALFESGDIPTQQNFADLIDTLMSRGKSPLIQEYTTVGSHT